MPGPGPDLGSDLALDHAWALHPQVSLRPEPFGALLYHFGTRRLTFLKDPRLVEVVRRLPGAASARVACEECRVPASELRAYSAALASLVDTSMLVERPTREIAAGPAATTTSPVTT
ncbi:mycofactocin biosynthesis chaperone MftB [Streptomyces sp. ATMOS53]|jgi:putative mycofactocin binding protein MftB